MQANTLDEEAVQLLAFAKHTIVQLGVLAIMKVPAEFRTELSSTAFLPR
jgi:hypothetical protein